jgi:hypothetical protein
MATLPASGGIVTFSYLGDSGGTMAIGGQDCHLCGSEIRTDNTYKGRSKKGVMRQTTYKVYACGTSVSVDHKGARCVLVGGKCIKMEVEF